MNCLAQRQALRAITSSLNIIPSMTNKTSLLVKERAKLQVVNRELERTKAENSKLKNELERTQRQVESQMQQTLLLRKQQQCHNNALIEQRALHINSKDKKVEDLETQLNKVRTELAQQIASATKREANLQMVVDQSARFEKEVQSLKQQQVVDQRNALAVKKLKSQRDDLLLIVKKQIKLTEILKQQTLHAKAATLLEITEKEFVKELF